MMIASHTKRLLNFLAIRRIVIMSLKALKMNGVIFEPRAAYQGWKSARSHDHTFARPYDRTTAGQTTQIRPKESQSCCLWTIKFPKRIVIITL